MAIRRGDLVNTDGTPATKNGSQDQYKIPDSDVAIANSQQIIFNGTVLKPVGSFSSVPTRYMECVISGQNVQVGLPPKAGDTLWYLCDV